MTQNKTSAGGTRASAAEAWVAALVSGVSLVACWKLWHCEPRSGSSPCHPESLLLLAVTLLALAGPRTASCRGFLRQWADCFRQPADDGILLGCVLPALAVAAQVTAFPDFSADMRPVLWMGLLCPLMVLVQLRWFPASLLGPGRAGSRALLVFTLSLFSAAVTWGQLRSSHTTAHLFNACVCAALTLSCFAWVHRFALGTLRRSFSLGESIAVSTLGAVVAANAILDCVHRGPLVVSTLLQPPLAGAPGSPWTSPAFWRSLAVCLSPPFPSADQLMLLSQCLLTGGILAGILLRPCLLRVYRTNLWEQRAAGRTHACGSPRLPASEERLRAPASAAKARRAPPQRTRGRSDDIPLPTAIPSKVYESPPPPAAGAPAILASAAAVLFPHLRPDVAAFYTALLAVVFCVIWPWVAWSFGGIEPLGWLAVTLWANTADSLPDTSRRSQMIHIPVRLVIAVYWLLVLAVGVLVFAPKPGRGVANIIVRKYYHLLAVVMFVPAMIIEPRFVSMAFTVAFTAFILVEYVRIAAVPPWGARIHAFMQKYLDDRDRGIAILTHTYLLLGCALPLWLHCRLYHHALVDGARYTLAQHQLSTVASQPLYPPDAWGWPADATSGGGGSLVEIGAPTGRTDYFPVICGVLVLGIGDAAASVFGTLLGRRHWGAGNKKTLEGSAGAVLSILAAAAAIAWSCQQVHQRMFRWFAPPVPETTTPGRLLVATLLTMLLEAWTSQIDNLFLPLFCYAVMLLV